MDIDWVTVVAQIVNFLVLVYLLKRFLYGPVINAMDSRAQLITDRLSEAEQRESAADSSRQEYQVKAESLQREEQALMDAAQLKAEEKQRQFLIEAHAQLSQQKKEWQLELAEEQQDFLQQLRNQGSHSILAVCEQVLSDLANASLQEQIVANFIQRLKKMDSSQKQTLISGSSGIQVTTSSDLSNELKSSIGECLQDLLGSKAISFTVNSDLLCGIEIKTTGYKLSWSVSDYLHQLKEHLQQILSKLPETGKQNPN